VAITAILVVHVTRASTVSVPLLLLLVYLVASVFQVNAIDSSMYNKWLSYRRETELQGRLVMAKSGRLELGYNIYGHYRSIFNHCDVFRQQGNRIR